MITRAMRLLTVGFVATVALLFSLGAQASGQSRPPVKTDPVARPSIILPDDDPQATKTGKLVGSVYTNDFFRFQLTVPDGWHVADAEGVAQIGERGAEAMSGGSPEKKAQASAAYQRTLKLITIGKLVQDEKGDSTALLIVGAEQVPSWLITSGRDYNNVVKRQMLNTPMKYEIDETMGTESVGGVEFTVMNVRSETSTGVLVKQRFYSAIRHGHALFFVTTYVSDKGDKDLAEVLKTVKFH